MPVRFAAGTSELHLTADGVVQTIIADPAGGIAPCFVSRTPLPDAPMAGLLHALRPDEKLIGLAADAGSVNQLFPDSKIVTVPLDPVHPLPGPPAAWQTLDAIVMNTNAAADLGDRRINLLVAGGTSLLVPADSGVAPDAFWPWRLDHRFWMLRAATPVIAAASDEDFAPVSSWQPGRSSSDRAQIVIMSVIWVIAVLLVSLIRPHWMAALTILVAAALAVTAVSVWDNGRASVDRAIGLVYAAGDPAVVDRWNFRVASRSCADSIKFETVAMPILALHGGPEHMALLCDHSGTPVEFDYDLVADHPAAFVFTWLGADMSRVGYSRPVTTPLRLLPASLYPGLEPVGQIAMPDAEDWTQWPTLVLAKSDAIPKNVSSSDGRDSLNR
jgi:hypothetical protein